MPIPKPTSNETKSDFIQRCMTDDKMVNEFENTDQRLAVCSTSYEDNLPKNTNED
jgi:uncharacterized protein involved in type VI secretion and phage assembly